MPLWKNTQHAFVAGQLDTHVMGRQDMEKYGRGATLLKNFLVKRQGCISKRRGTDLTADLDGILGTANDGTPITPGKMRLVPVTNGDDGRYVILSGGLGFVASREGLMAEHGGHMRRVMPYVGQDANGRPRSMSSGARDALNDPDTPLTVVRQTAPGQYDRVKKFSLMSDAFGAAKNGAEVVLHNDYVMTEQVLLTSESFTLSDGGSGQLNYENYEGYNRWVLLRTGTRYPQQGSRNRYQPTLTFNVGGNTVTATRKSRTVTLDLNGYTLTCAAGSSGFVAAVPAVTLKVVSSRPGARFAERGSGGPNTAISCKNPNYDTDHPLAGGNVVLDGEIEWTMATKSDRVLDVTGGLAVIERGTFRRNPSSSTNASEYFFGPTMTTGSRLTINGGEFETGGEGDIIAAGRFTPLEINGGEFRIPDGQTTSCLFSLHGDAQLLVQGGRFLCDKDRFDPSRNTNRWTRDTTNSAHFPAGKLNIVRGEFSFDELVGSDGTYANGSYVRTYWPIWKFGKVEADGTLTVANDSLTSGGWFGFKQEGEGDYELGGMAGAEPYRFNIPYADEDLADLCIRQSGDTLFIAHRDYSPAKIMFDRAGYAYFEELRFDNTEYERPVIESAEMSGAEPKETDQWPAEFPRPKETGDSDGDCVDLDPTGSHDYWYVGGCPSWLDSSQKTAAARFRQACLALGTVTDAGFNGNSTSGEDGSYSRACSYTCTSVSTDHATGRKTTTVSVKSFTASATVEEKVNYVNGQAQGWFDPDTGQITLPSQTRTTTAGGSAENSASVTSAIVTRTVRYVATYVKDGKESRPSQPVAVDYDMPWPNNAVVNLTLSKGRNAAEPDYYNVYKDNGNGYGLIATTGQDSVRGGAVGSLDTYSVMAVDNATGEIVVAAEKEKSRGRAEGDTLRRLETSHDFWTSSPAGDEALVVTSSKAATDGIRIDISAEGESFRCLAVAVDARLYDGANDMSYLLLCSSQVTCAVHFENNTTLSLTVNLPSVSVDAAYHWPSVFDDWVAMPTRNFTAENGDTVVGWACGRGDMAEELNRHVRVAVFDFYSRIESLRSAGNSPGAAQYVTLTFQASAGYHWPLCQQGVLHSVHIGGGTLPEQFKAERYGSGVGWARMKGDGTTSSSPLSSYASRGAGYGANGGMVQDDYINPDMTVTPPNDAKDEHFAVPGEFPGCVGIYEQRLVFASTRSSPSTIWMSRIADLYNFTAHDSIREDDALELTLAATEFPNINHLVMGRDLMLFGDGGEWLVAPVQGNALTYKTASAKLQSMIGSERTLNPLQLADETLFAERGGTCLRSINYNYTSDSYQSEDLSVIAQSIFRANPIVSMAYKQHPDSIVECVLKDGRVATLVYMKEQEVAAWSVQELGGGWKAREIATPKCIVDGTTEMMLLVEKGGVFQLWKVRNDNDEATDAARVTLDGLRVERSAESAAEGEVAVALGDGKYAVGWPVVSEFVSVRPEPEKGPTAQMEVKNATEAEVRVIDASTFSVKPYGASSGWREVSLPVVRDGSSVALAEKDCKKLMTGFNNRDGRLHLKHSEPWPLTILSISTTYQVEYENGGNDGQ